MSGWVKNSPVKIRPCFVAVYEKIKKNRTGNHTQALERYKEVLEVGAISSYLFLFPYRMRSSDCELYESHRQGSLICLMHEK